MTAVKLEIVSFDGKMVCCHFSHINLKFSSHSVFEDCVSANMIAHWKDFPFTLMPDVQTGQRHWGVADRLFLVTGVSRACCPKKTTTHSMQSQHTSRRSMQYQFTPRNLPRLHSADKSFSFALNYPKYFPKAPGSASKSFYRQKIEAQWAEGENGEKGRCEGQRRGRNEQQQIVKEGNPMQCHYREWMLLRWLSGTASNITQ